jgi:hypothetical protein
MSYPLYDILSKSLPSHPPTNEEKSFVIKQIKKLDSQAHEAIYTLLRIHSLQKRVNFDIFGIPYGGSKSSLSNESKSDIKFSIKDIDDDAVHLVIRFITQHSSATK